MLLIFLEAGIAKTGCKKSLFKKDGGLLLLKKQQNRLILLNAFVM
jgi:hypothetical protein